MGLRERAAHWLWDRGLCPKNPTGTNRYTLNVDSLAALLTASVAEAVAQEREACAKEVPTTWLHPMFIDNDKLDGPTTEWICKQIALAIRARTTTPTPSPTGGRVPLPSGEQPGVGELVEALGQLYIHALGMEERLAAGRASYRPSRPLAVAQELIARARQQGSPSASQPRADYDAGEKA